MIVASEGIKDSKGKFIAESGSKDAFGHSQLGGVAPRLAELVNSKLKLKIIGLLQTIFKEVLAIYRQVLIELRLMKLAKKLCNLL